LKIKEKKHRKNKIDFTGLYRILVRGGTAQLVLTTSEASRLEAIRSHVLSRFHQETPLRVTTHKVRSNLLEVERVR